MMTAESRLTLNEFLQKLADELDYPPRWARLFLGPEGMKSIIQKMRQKGWSVDTYRSSFTKSEGIIGVEMEGPGEKEKIRVGHQSEEIATALTAGIALGVIQSADEVEGTS